MRNFLKLAEQDAHFRAELLEAQADDLYRRALIPLLLLGPVLYVFYLVVADVTVQRPIITWIFAVMFALMLPRLALVLLVQRIKARFPDPRVRIGLFAAGTALHGIGMAAVNLLAAPLVSPEQLALLAITAAGINSIAIVSMAPSLLSYLLYMVPNIASIAIAILIGPEFQYGGIFLFLIATNLFALVFMATSVHLKGRRSILLRLKVDEANASLRHLNRQLQSEIEVRLAVEDTLQARNVEQATLNKKLAGAQTQLLQSEKMASIGQLAAGVAHEINNPIAFVRSNLSSLKTYVSDIVSVLDAYENVERENDSKESAQSKLDQLKGEVNLAFLREDIPSLLTESSDGLTRVEKIVKNLREFSHVDAVEWKTVDIQESLECTLSIAAHDLRGSADVVREYTNPPRVECLPVEINQVFLSLLINAAQAMPRRGTITVRTGYDEQAVWVQIADSGTGIEPAHIGRIFDPFFSTKVVGIGPGLGLSVSYGIMQKHGGSIDVVSEVGKGSTFTVRLPRVVRQVT